MPLLVCGFDATAYGQKTIHLTFDMDMNEVMYERALTRGEKWYDPALFTYLEQSNVAATFFVSGLFVLAYPDLIENLASNPAFSFQNHSYDEASFTPHCYRLNTLTTARQKIDRIQRTEQIIKNYTGQRATYFRFPGICTNAQENALVESLGYAVEDGTVVAGDPFNENLQAIVNAVLAKAKNEATVIMHVGGANAPKSLAALEQIVPQLRAQGYQFATLNDQSRAGEAMSSDRPQPPTGRRRAVGWSSRWRRLKARQHRVEWRQPTSSIQHE
jgi:peptidoglycan/xylan/chitin deacetylase (PgdA/CDA1 family)